MEILAHRFDDMLIDLNKLHSQANYKLNILWNLDADIAPLLQQLGAEACMRLHENKICDFNGFRLYYQPTYVFGINYAKFYGIDRFFPDEAEPETLEKLYNKGLELIAALRVMGIVPLKLSSPIAIWEEAVMKHLDLPTALDMPEEAAELAWQCSGKIWTEAYQVGYFEKTYDYDIIASYPSVMKDLIDTRNCDWVQSDKYQPQAIYGYCKCKVMIYPDVQVSPIIYEDSQGNLSTPTGVWETCLTKSELDFMDKWDIGVYEIQDGWWAMPRDNKRSKPLEVVINRLLAYRENENKLVSWLAKQMAVGVHGKFGEDWGDKFGPHFNPCWFAEISTQIRLKVAEFIYEHELEDNLIHVATDGVLVDREVEL